MSTTLPEHERPGAGGNPRAQQAGGPGAGGSGAGPGGTASGPGDTAGYRLGPLYLTLPLANIALYMIWIGVGSFLIPLQVAQITGENDTDALTTASTTGAILATIGNPLFGLLSDRTRSRWGRRAPWVLLCAGVGCLALVGQAKASSIAMLGFTWGMVQLFMNGYMAASTAAMPDRVPVRKYGTFSALIGLGIPLATIIASLIIGGVPGEKFGLSGTIGGFDGKFMGEKGYYLIAVIVFASAVIFVLVSPDKPNKDVPREKFELKEFLSGFWVSPKEHPDFFWAFASRFGVMVGYWIVSVYTMFILIEYIEIPGEEIGPAMGYQLIINALATVAASMVIGPLVDRIGRIKPFVLICGVGSAASLAIPMLSPTEGGMEVFQIVNGIFFGTYMAVDLALMTKVLPSSGEPGKDLGIVNIAAAGPQIAAPTIAGWIVDAGGYEAIFPIAAVVSLGGAFLVLKVRAVR
ncbi:MFS transporter [Yinghuangia soli]|uniref:MFS transporter n=1 Tax=Yinghuangia soli TaxID=2908204 RepID=A0AA41PUG2_9ACTN|nr:MFS transporter [Yinghuangia soli]MCF2525802.1 MFS transporter [Yinghuangia soli]